jgi:hypothetical protein
MNGAGTMGCPRWAGPARRSATRRGNGRGTRTGTGSARSTSTRWKGCGRACGISCDRSGGGEQGVPLPVRGDVRVELQRQASDPVLHLGTIGCEVHHHLPYMSLTLYPPVGHAASRPKGELTTTPRPLAPFGSYRVPKKGQSSGRARLLRTAEFTRGATPALRGQGLG